ncbi:aldo/keto reductase [Pontibacter sp. BT310]|uniref:Aldo/keto reductase n=1 Tax=Pontibacter populi TaxID=890055 RepID=A0ABS6XDP3_9BACT|nr:MULTISPECIES: aldo/keto reductase [Pontibacter]MBJ6119225.1 aldo/keto reductase [Pontibacter sp. BT310]MBR0571653.1 aldo/keto reductase [Microvirga sp. STS03]MBW3366079.1 aldo/keto reductase [Pontibacter populi]
MADNTSITKTFTIGNDLTVNRMGFGAMRITGEGIWGPPKDKDEAIKVLHRTVELGINFIDTADSYGPNVSEELIAEALYPYPKDLVIATKGGLTRTGPNVWPINADPDYLQKALEGSLERLKQDRIDLYQLHRVDPEVPYEKTLEFLQRVQEEGLVKHIGLSEVTVDQIRKAQKYFKVVSVQNKYSVDFRTKWEEELKFCQEQDMAFIPWNPINAGNVGAIDKLTEIGKKYDASAHQVALSWLLHHSPNILLIPGTSKVKHLEENYRAASIVLSDEDLQELDKIKQSEK